MSKIVPQPLLATISGALVPNRQNMNDCFPDLAALNRKKILNLISECYAEYSHTMDGSHFHTEAECIIIRVVHKKTNKIHEIVVCLGLFAKSLDGATIAQHTVETLTGESVENDNKGLSIKLKDCRALALDRVSTKKRRRIS